MGGRVLIVVCALLVFVSAAVVAEAKFTCEVISVDDGQLVLENCKDMVSGGLSLVTPSVSPKKERGC